MDNLKQLSKKIESAKTEKTLSDLYGRNLDVVNQQRTRYLNLLEDFSKNFPEQNYAEIFSSPGRTEIGGNHTDHNAGRVIAGAVNLDIVAIISKNSRDLINIYSEGYDFISVDISQKNFKPLKEENFTPVSIVKGVCARFLDLGLKIGGFDARLNSCVPKGLGLSSSATFEVIISQILNHLFNEGKISQVDIALISQYSENVYFGKPCGLMDQTTCSIGGLVAIDFKDLNDPLISKVNYNFEDSGYSIIIVDTGGNHADLNNEYISIENEMKSVARILGGKVLREFSIKEILDNINFLREKVNDRAILRSIHFFNDDERVVKQIRALENNDFESFLKLVIESGYSSWMLCQNCYTNKHIESQGISIGLAISGELLKNRGAWRVHGGGFAGTIQAFVPNGIVNSYMKLMDVVFGEGSCCKLIIRPYGAIKLEI